MAKKRNDATWSGDLIGGSLAALMSVPAAMAYGVLVFGSIGPSWTSKGVVAGLTALALANIASAPLAGSRILSNSPGSLPSLMLAAAVPNLLTIFGSSTDNVGEVAMLAIVLTVALSGAIQILLGALKFGDLAKFVPYPVTAGLLTGIGLLILKSQLNPLLGVVNGGDLYHDARWPCLGVGLGTVAAITLGPRLIKKIPGPIWGIVAGSGLYYLLLYFVGAEHLGPTVGSIPIAIPSPEYLPRVVGLLSAQSTLAVLLAICPLALCLAAVNSLDSLVGTIAGDSVSGNRSNCNQELLSQGTGNIISAAFGGIASVGSASRTLVNYQSGGRTPRSRVVSGIFALTVLLFLAPIMAHVPVVVLAGLLVSAALGTFDRWVFYTGRAIVMGTEPNPKNALFNLGTLVLVTALILLFGVVEAVGAGVLLSLIFFVVRMSKQIVRRQYAGNMFHSNSQRNLKEFQILENKGDRIQVLELEGALFFGTADKVSQLLEELANGQLIAILLDMRQITEIDISGAKVLERSVTQCRDKEVELLACVAEGTVVKQQLDDFGVVTAFGSGRLFNDINEALDVAENLLLDVIWGVDRSNNELGLGQIDSLVTMSPEEIETVRPYIERVEFADGELLFAQGDSGDEVYCLAQGCIRIDARVPDTNRWHRIATLNAGTLVGEIALIDQRPRSTNARADGAVITYRLGRDQLEMLTVEHAPIATKLLVGIAREIATRLRIANRCVR
jgi:SulP family sulfate permease